MSSYVMMGIDVISCLERSWIMTSQRIILPPHWIPISAWRPATFSHLLSHFKRLLYQLKFMPDILLRCHLKLDHILIMVCMLNFHTAGLET